MKADLLAVYDTLGVSPEDTLTVSDVRSVYHRVLYVPVSPQQVQHALRKVNGDSNDKSCRAERILDALLEIERDRVTSEKLYWDSHILNAGKTRAQKEQCALDIKQSGSIASVSNHTILQIEKNIEDEQKRLWKMSYGCRLKKDVKRLCNRLARGGLCAVLPSLWSTSGFSGPERSGLSDSDLIQDVEEKYEILRRKLCGEMLQEEHGRALWDCLLPWQREEKVEEMGALVENILNTAELLRLCDLPGAFRLYRCSDQVALRSCPEDPKPDLLEWTAVFSLIELHEKHQLEKRTLTPLVKSLDRTSLKLLSLHVKLTVLKAERESDYHSAMLASRQNWENWPHMEDSPCEHLAKIWLDEKNSNWWKRDLIPSGSSQQVPIWHQLLHCMLSCHERERKCLIKMLHSYTADDLLGQVGQPLPAEGSLSGCPAALRGACIIRLRQMKASLEHQSKPSSWGKCALRLLTHLMELQEVEVRPVLQVLLEMDNDKVMELKRKYEADLMDQKWANLSKLLIAGSWPQGNADVMATEKIENIVSGHLGESGINVESPSTVINSHKNSLCIACGSVINPDETPYLEIAFASSEGQQEMTTSNSEVRSECGNVEKQASLITLAWSQPAQDSCSAESSFEAEIETKTDLSQVEMGITETSTENAMIIHDHPQDERLQEQHSEGQACSGEDTVVGSWASRDYQGVHDNAEGLTSQWSETLEDVREKPAEKSIINEKCMQREMTVVQISEMEREETMKSLVDMQKMAESKYQRDKERQILRVRERLSIIQNRKSDEDLLGHQQRDGLKHLTENLKKEDRNRQKALVKEKLEQLRRERSCVMQSKRDRNTAGFKELLEPMVLNRADLGERLSSQ